MNVKWLLEALAWPFYVTSDSTENRSVGKLFTTVNFIMLGEYYTIRANFYCRRQFGKI